VSKFIFTVDWEDFGQLYSWYQFKKILPPQKNIDRQTNIILEQLSRYDIKATFFVLGMLAKHCPDLVKKISAQGHEIALHGFNHIDLNLLDRKEIEADIALSKDIVTQITGKPVLGYRAPFFSLTANRLFVLEVLSEMGFLYDSSIYPASAARFSIPGFSPAFQNYQLKKGTDIVELPMTTYPLRNWRLGFTGGGYMRLAPKQLLRNVIKKLSVIEEFTMLYMHPYEFDNERISVEAYQEEGYKFNPLKKNLLDFRWNLFRNSIIHKLDKVFETYGAQFQTCEEAANIIKERPLEILKEYSSDIKN